MNSFQSIQSGMGLLKNDYMDGNKEPVGDAFGTALKRKKSKLMASGDNGDDGDNNSMKYQSNLYDQTRPLY